MLGKPKKICLVGAPSTGKTTLAESLAKELRQKNYSVELVKEFARDYIVQHGPIDNLKVQLAIARGQKGREEAASSSSPEFVVCDAASFLSYIYFDFLKDTALKSELAAGSDKIKKDILEEIENEAGGYDFVFFLPPEFIPQEDGIRLYTDKVEEISGRIKAFLASQDIKYYEVRGSTSERLNQILGKVLR